MTGFIGMTASNSQILGMLGCSSNDDGAQPVDYRVSPPGKRGGFALEYRFGADFLWPRSSFIGSVDGVAAGPYVTDAVAHYWDPVYSTAGVHVPKKVIGQTLNGAGAALGGCIVQLFNTATGLLVDTQTSDSAGNFSLSDPNNVACFVVAYEAGSPDVAGTTVNTLTGV